MIWAFQNAPFIGKLKNSDLNRSNRISTLLWIGVCITAMWLLNACYSFQGASIPPDLNTYSVDFFQNKAATINPKLSQIVTEKLKDKMNNTRLNFTRENGDFAFSGTITGYTVAPIAVQENANASKNRLTIVVNVQFVCNKHPELNFNSDFSAFEDFDATKNFSTLENTLVSGITDQLIQEIFNKAAVNW